MKKGRKCVWGGWFEHIMCVCMCVYAAYLVSSSWLCNDLHPVDGWNICSFICRMAKPKETESGFLTFFCMPVFYHLSKNYDFYTAEMKKNLET